MVKVMQVKPNNRVKEGFVEYAFDSATGTLEYKVSVSVSWYFFGRKTFVNEGSVQLDPAQLVPGAKLQFGEVQLEVKEVDDRNYTHATVRYAKGDVVEYGSVVFAVKKGDLCLHAMNLRVLAKGVLVNVLVG